MHACHRASIAAVDSICQLVKELVRCTWQDPISVRCSCQDVRRSWAAHLQRAQVRLWTHGWRLALVQHGGGTLAMNVLNVKRVLQGIKHLDKRDCGIPPFHRVSDLPALSLPRNGIMCTDAHPLMSPWTA